MWNSLTITSLHSNIVLSGNLAPRYNTENKLIFPCIQFFGTALVLPLEVSLSGAIVVRLRGRNGLRSMKCSHYQPGENLVVAESADIVAALRPIFDVVWGNAKEIK